MILTMIMAKTTLLWLTFQTLRQRKLQDPRDALVEERGEKVMHNHLPLHERYSKGLAQVSSVVVVSVREITHQ